MSVISNSHPPEIPPPAPNLEPDNIELPASRAQSPPMIASDFGPIRKDDAENTRFNPMPSKVLRTYGRNKRTPATPSVARSVASASRSSPDTFVVDMPLKGETTQSSPDIDIQFIPKDHRIPSQERFPLLGAGLEPQRMQSPAYLTTDTPEHDQLVLAMSDANYAALNLTAKLEYEALTKFSAPQEEVMLAEANTLKDMVKTPFKRIFSMLQSRRNYTMAPLSAEERAVYYDLLAITGELHHIINNTIENLATPPPSPKMLSTGYTEIPSSIQGETRKITDDDISLEHILGEEDSAEICAMYPEDFKKEDRDPEWQGTEPWSQSPEPNPNPNVAIPQRSVDDIIGTPYNPSVHTQVTNAEEHQLLESVKFMFFIAHNRFPSVDECKDKLARFNPNKFGKWVQTTDEDMRPISPSAESIKSNETVRAEPPKPAEPTSTPVTTPSFTPGQPKKKEKKFKKLTDLPVPTPPTQASASTEKSNAEKAAAVEKARADLAEKHKSRLEAPGAPKVSAKTAPAVKNAQPSAVAAVTKEGIANALAVNPPNNNKISFAGAAKAPAAQAPKPADTNASAPQKFKEVNTKNTPKGPTPPKGPRYLIKTSPPIPKEWFDHNSTMRVRNRIVEYFAKVEKQYGKKSYPRCLAAGFTPAGHISVDFSPETLDADVVRFQEGLMREIQAPGLHTLTRNTEWTKIVISHVPTHLYVPDIDAYAPNVSTGEDLKLVMLDNIPQSFLDKYPMPVYPKWLQHPTVIKSNNWKHSRAILTVEDPEKTAFDELHRLGCGFGMHHLPSRIERYNEKPLLSECNRCCSYECPNPQNCRRPPKCGLCGARHTTATHNAQCAECKKEGRTNIIDNRACTHTAKCPACKGPHEFGDRRCEKRKGYRENTRNVLMCNRIDNTAPPSEGGDADHPMTVDKNEPQAGLITQTSDSNKDAVLGSSSNPIQLDA